MASNKSLGQHWLTNRTILEEIATLAVPATPVPVCLEIGPGLGTLTSSLLKRFEKVVAVELDADLAAKLPRSFPGKNLVVVQADILQFDFSVLGAEFAVAGNIPYYITSPIITKLLNLPILPRKIVLLVQKEVAERIVSEKESLLSLSVKNRAAVQLGPEVPRTEFTPPPKVDSQVIVLSPHAPEVGEAVMRLIRQGFSAPRKQLKHNLASLGTKTELEQALAAAGIATTARPGDLHLADWARLDKIFRDLA